MEHLIPELMGQKDSGMLERASITDGGALTDRFAYLKEYLEGKE
jgi:hypothetical protein